MDIEFLDLIKTFEKTLKRLELLDQNVTSFKDILETLRENLDELVEMVMLEEIIDLSKKSTDKILTLNQQLDNLMISYSALSMLKKEREEELNRFDKIEQTLEHLNQIIKNQSSNSKCFSSSKLIELEEGYYVINEVEQLIFYSKEAETFEVMFGAKRLAKSEDLLFVSRETDLMMIKNREILLNLPIQCDEFYVEGYQIYFLNHQELKSYHLVTQEITLIESDVIQIQPIEKGILIQTMSQIKKYEI